MRLLILLLSITISAFAEDPPSISEITARLAAMNYARAVALHQYNSTRIYQVVYKGFPKTVSAKAIIRLDYTAPDNKKFDILKQEGSTFLINRVIKTALESEQEAAKPEFHNRSALNSSNYVFKFLETSTENGRPCYLLQVTPKRADKYLYDGQICVDAVDFAIARLDAQPAKNPSFWISRAHIESHNQKIGEFWLPSTTRSTSHVRLGGNAELDIRYDDYQITPGSSVHNPAKSSSATP